MLSRFHLIPECYGQTDGQIAISISRVSMLTRDKNEPKQNLKKNLFCSSLLYWPSSYTHRRLPTEERPSPAIAENTNFTQFYRY